MNPIKCVIKDEIIDYVRNNTNIKARKLARSSGNDISKIDRKSIAINEVIPKYISKNWEGGIESVDMQKDFIKAAHEALTNLGIDIDQNTLMNQLFNKTEPSETSEDVIVIDAKEGDFEEGIFNNVDPSIRLAKDLMDIYGKQPYACRLMLSQFDSIMVPTVFAKGGHVVRIDEIPINIYRQKLQLAMDVMEAIETYGDDFKGRSTVEINGERYTVASIRNRFKDVADKMDAARTLGVKKLRAMEKSFFIDDLDILFNFAFGTQKGGNKISYLAQSTEPRDRAILEAYNKLFILKNMDSLIDKVFNRVFDVSQYAGETGIRFHEYDMRTLNNLAKNWHDEEKDMSAIEQAGNITRSIIGALRMFNYTTGEYMSGKLGYNNFVFAIGTLKGLYMTDLVNYRRNDMDSKTLGDYISALTTGGPKAYKEFFDYLFSKKNNNSKSNTKVIDDIAEVLFRNNKMGLQRTFKNAVYSIYTEIFETGENAKGMRLYESYRDFINDYDNPDYFSMIAHFMGSISNINYYYVSEDKGMVKSKPMSEMPADLAKKRIEAKIYNVADSLYTFFESTESEYRKQASGKPLGEDNVLGDNYRMSIEYKKEGNGDITSVTFKNVYIPVSEEYVREYEKKNGKNTFDYSTRLFNVTIGNSSLGTYDNYEIVQAIPEVNNSMDLNKPFRIDNKNFVETITVSNSNYTTTVDKWIEQISQSGMMGDIDFRRVLYGDSEGGVGNGKLGRSLMAVFSASAASYYNRNEITGKKKTRDEAREAALKFLPRWNGVGKTRLQFSIIPTGVLMNPISPNEVEWVDMLVEATMTVDRSNTKSTVKTKAGKQMNMYQLKRLLSDPIDQFSRIRSDENAAANKSIPHISVFEFIDSFEGELTAEEMDGLRKGVINENIFGKTVIEDNFTSKNDAKRRRDYNIHECLYSDFMMDYMRALSDYKIIGRDDIHLFTKINADKSIIDKQSVSIRFIRTLDKMADAKSITDKYESEIKQLGLSDSEAHIYRVSRLLAKGLHRIYERTVNNINNDISSLQAFMQSKIGNNQDESMISIAAFENEMIGDNRFSKRDRIIMSNTLIAMARMQEREKAAFLSDQNNVGKQYIPSNDYLSIKNNYSKFNGIVNEANESSMKEGVVFSAAEALNVITKIHNAFNPRGEIKIIDQTHILPEGNSIYFNPQIIEQLYRYSETPQNIWNKDVWGFDKNSFEAYLARYKNNLNQYTTADEYFNTLGEAFKRKKNELFFYMMQQDIRLSQHSISGYGVGWRTEGIQMLHENNNENGFIPVRSAMKGWMDDNLMTLARITLTDGRVIDIHKLTDLRDAGINVSSLSDPNKFMEELESIGGSFEINPALLHFNFVDFFLGEQYKLNTTGASFNHPTKAVYPDGRLMNGLESEALHNIAANKRNVSHTASLDQFKLNKLDGIGDSIRVACVEDIQDNVSNYSGDLQTIKPHDGICHVSPVAAYWLLNSTGDSKVGMDMKPFLHSYDTDTATGIIIKSSFNSLTNEMVRKGKNVRNLMYKTMAYQWRDMNGNLINGDIFRDYGMNRYDRNGKKSDLAIYLISKYNPLVQLSDGVYRISNITYDPNTGIYRRVFDKVDEKGETIANEYFYESEEQGMQVHSNYDLWRLFGAENSREYNKGLNRIVPSENSIRMIADLGNLVGLDVRPGNENAKFENKEYFPQDQTECYQFMKKGNADLIVSNGAIKQGFANVNRVEDVIYNQDGLPSTFLVDTRYFGIQLDPTHTANNSQVSELTQVINALSSMGYTSEESSRIYKALGIVAQSSIDDLINKMGVKDVSTMSFKQMRDLVSNILVKAMAERDALSDDDRGKCAGLIERVNNGEVISYNDLAGILSLNDANFISKVMPAVTSYINSISIKKKFPGTLSLLKASYGLIHIYGNGSWEELGLDDEKKMEKALSIQTEYNNNSFKNPSRIMMGHNYRISFNVPEISMDESTLGVLNGMKLTTKHDISDDGTTSFYITLKTYEDYAKLRKIASVVNRIGDYSISEYLVRPAMKGDMEYVEGQRTDIIEGRELAPINIIIHPETENGQGTLNLYDLDSIRSMFILKRIQKKKGNIDRNDPDMKELAGMNSETVIRFLNERGYRQYTIMSDMQAIAPLLHQLQLDELGKIYNGQSGTIIYRGVAYNVPAGAVEVYPYESVTPNINATKYGLDKYTKLNEVTPELFAKKMLDKWDLRVDPDLYDYALMFDSGRHVYVSDSNISGKFDDSGLTEIDVTKDKSWEKIGGRYYLMRNNNSILSIKNGSERVYKDGGGNLIIRVNSSNSSRDNMNKFLQSMRFMDFVISPKMFTEERIGEGEEGLKNATDYFVKLATDNRYKYAKDRSVISGSGSMSFQAYDDASQIREAVVDSYDISKYLDKNTNINDALNSKKQEAIAALSQPNGIELLKKDKSLFLQKVYKNAMDRYKSFMTTLDSLVARIPSQTQQSFMGMHTVMFDNTGVNACFVNDMQLWLEGSDFDGDKVTFQQYAVDNRGLFIGWSPYFDVSNLFGSKRIPFPTGQESSMVDLNEMSAEERAQFAMTEEQTVHFDNLFMMGKDGKYLLKSKHNVNDVVAFIEDANIMMRNNGGLSYRNINENPSVYSEVINFLDVHNKYFNEYSKSKIDGVKNFITYYSQRIINNPVNLREAQSSIDDFPMIKDEGKNDIENTIRNRLNTMNVLTKYMAFTDNMLGKDGVSVAAANIKNFFSLTEHFNTIGESLSDAEVNELGSNLEALTEYVSMALLGEFNEKTGFATGVEIAGKTYMNFANWNPSKPLRRAINIAYQKVKNDILERATQEPIMINEMAITPENIDWALSEQYERLYKNKSIGLKEYQVAKIVKIVQNASMDMDRALLISSLISESTDNAKNLNLAKINCTKETMPLYIYGIAIGMNFSTLAMIMRSNIAKTYVRMKQDNSFINDDAEKLSLSTLSSRYVARYHKSDDGIGNIPNNANFKNYDKVYDGAYLNNTIFSSNELVLTLNKNIYDESGRVVSTDEVKMSPSFIYNEFVLKGLEWDNNSIFKGVDELEVLNTIESYAIEKYGNINPGAVQNLREWISGAKDLIYLRKEAKSEQLGGESMLDILVKLERGVNEMSKMAKISGTNKGVKQTLAKQAAFLSGIEQIISEKYKTRDPEKAAAIREFFNKYPSRNPYNRAIIRNGQVMKEGSGTFDINRFSNDSEYRSDVIDLYEKVFKNTFNVPEAAANLPHLFAYLRIQNLTTNMITSLSPITYASNMIASAIMDRYDNNLSERERESIIKNTRRYVDSMMFDLFLRQYNNGNAFRFYIPRGFTKFVMKSDGSIDTNPVEKITEVTTNSKAGKMTFLKWMNEVVIPNYKNGIWNEGDTNKRIAFVNQFISDLSGRRIDKTLTGNLAFTWSLNDDKRSNDPNDMLRVSQHEFAASKLSGEKYMNLGPNKSLREFSMADLLFIMDQMIFNGANADGSINDYISTDNSAVKRAYYEFVDNRFLDDDGNFREDMVQAIVEGSNEILEQIAQTVAPDGYTNSNSRAKYIRSFNWKTGNVEIYKKSSENSDPVFYKENNDEDDYMNQDIMEMSEEQNNFDMMEDSDIAEDYSMYDDGGSGYNMPYNQNPGYNSSKYDLLATKDQVYDVFPVYSVPKRYLGKRKAISKQANPIEPEVAVQEVQTQEGAQEVQVTREPAQKIAYENVRDVIFKGKTDQDIVNRLFDEVNMFKKNMEGSDYNTEVKYGDEQNSITVITRHIDEEGTPGFDLLGAVNINNGKITGMSVIVNNLSSGNLYQYNLDRIQTMFAVRNMSTKEKPGTLGDYFTNAYNKLINKC